MDILHIYAQDSWHQTATIVGNREGLQKLANALNKLLSITSGHAETFETFANDGEGYECRVLWLEHEATWQQIATPYTDDICQRANEGKVIP